MNLKQIRMECIMGKSDRELLELAAKAAGLQLCGYSWIGENEDDEECEILESAFVKIHPEQEIATKWNPLTDDGDALRLEVRLGLQVTTGTYGKHESCAYSPKSGEHTVYVCYDTDMLSATRRAIVLAAAAIGETMK